MKIHRAPGWTGAILLIALLAVGCGDPESGSDLSAGAAPPVLLITVDGLVAEELSAFGGERATPALESLVGSAEVWRDGWTACPMTRPAAATYLTGLAPDRHRVIEDMNSPLSTEIPTLATLLAERGYATAAFPNSSFLGSRSGLLRGFEIVDDPPPLRIGPVRFFPADIAQEEGADHFALWLESLPADAPYFAWIHFAGPLQQQFDDLGQSRFGITFRGPRGKGKGQAGQAVSADGSASSDGGQPESAPTGQLARFDAALGRVLAALEARGDAGRTAVILAPTMGDIGGGGSEPPGPGFSLGERAIRVPLVVRFPAGTPPRPARDRSVWAPDVAATVAALTGIRMGEETEGLSLLESGPPERPLLAWSWATRDQLGWLPLRAARLGAWKRSEGVEPETARLDGTEGEPGPEVEAALQRALDARAELEPGGVEFDAVRAWFEAHDLAPRPLPAQGRAFGPAEARRDTGARVWLARYLFLGRVVQGTLGTTRRALETDPENLAALLDRGQTLSMTGSEEALTVLRGAAELYPANFDVLHWLGHAMWADAWQDAEQLLIAILPYRPDDFDVLYDLACARSLDGDAPAAADFLRAAIEAGMHDWHLMDSDPDLRNLRESPHFSEVLREYGR